MVVRIRCVRFGQRNKPYYRIWAADSRAPRNGRHLEQLGTYDPIPDKYGNKHIRLNSERIKYWIGVGAQPSDRVAMLLGKFGIVPELPQRTTIPNSVYKQNIKEKAAPAWWGGFETGVFQESLSSYQAYPPPSAEAEAEAEAEE